MRIRSLDPHLQYFAPPSRPIFIAVPRLPSSTVFHFWRWRGEPPLPLLFLPSDPLPFASLFGDWGGTEREEIGLKLRAIASCSLVVRSDFSVFSTSNLKLSLDPPRPAQDSTDPPPPSSDLKVTSNIRRKGTLDLAQASMVIRPASSYPRSSWSCLFIYPLSLPPPIHFPPLSFFAPSHFKLSE